MAQELLLLLQNTLMGRFMKKFNAVLVSCLFVAAAGSASATPITDPSQLTGPLTTIDFNSLTAYPGVAAPYSIYYPGVTLSNITNVIDVDGFGAAATYPTYISDKAIGLPDLLTSSPNFTITFDQAVSAVGFGIFDPNFAGNIIRAFDADGNLIESTSPDNLGLPGGATADYVGFVTATPLIKSIEINAGLQAGYMDALWIDNLSFTSVPTPPAVLLLLAGLGMMSRRLIARREAVLSSILGNTSHI